MDSLGETPENAKVIFGTMLRNVPVPERKELPQVGGFLGIGNVTQSSRYPEDIGGLPMPREGRVVE